MNQNQINELILEALVTTEIDVTRGICQCKFNLLSIVNSLNLITTLRDFNPLLKEFELLLRNTCKQLKVYSNSKDFPIKGSKTLYVIHIDNLWDMDTEYGQLRHRVYDQMIFTLQDTLGITE